MTDLQFTEEQEFSQPSAVSQPSALIRLVLSTGLAKTQRGAEYVLLAIVGIGIVAALFIAFSGKSTSPQNPFKEGQSVFAPAGRSTR